MAICTTKHNPSKDPKFHQIEIFDGAGMSTSAPFIILNRGWDLRIGIVIGC